MNHLDLFSGIGGFSLGLERIKDKDRNQYFKTVAFCEIEEFCQQVLKKFWPEIKIYENIKNVTRERLVSDNIRRIDIITGGFPCQDISIAGNQKGIEAKQSGLWSEFCRIIGDIRPKYAIVENVTALISGDHGRWFGKVLGDLAEIGYDCEWHCISASEFGANHHRDRIWIIAYPERKKKVKKKFINCDVANNFGSRILRSSQEKIFGKQQFAWFERVRNIEDYFNRSEIPEPLLCGTDDGLRNRLHAIGNAVVPQIPEFIGIEIMKIENENEKIL